MFHVFFKDLKKITLTFKKFISILARIPKKRNKLIQISKDAIFIQVPIFTEATGPIYKREIATHDFMTNTPFLEGINQQQQLNSLFKCSYVTCKV